MYPGVSAPPRIRPLDMLFNVLASVMAVAASVALAWARRRGE